MNNNYLNTFSAMCNSFHIFSFQPGRKKKFIDKKNAVTFHLVHRSQRDPLQADDEAPQHVLMPLPSASEHVGITVLLSFTVTIKLCFIVQSHLVITWSSGGIFWDCGISEARYRFCRQVFFF